MNMTFGIFYVIPTEKQFLLLFQCYFLPFLCTEEILLQVYWYQNSIWRLQTVKEIKLQYSVIWISVCGILLFVSDTGCHKTAKLMPVDYGRVMWQNYLDMSAPSEKSLLKKERICSKGETPFLKGGKNNFDRAAFPILTELPPLSVSISLNNE